MLEIGFVVIGRNEGSRLVNCLDSLLPVSNRIVYVDSGSTDDSCLEAQKRGLLVVHLDLALPFTAARARNEGWRVLTANFPQLEFIHFIDGDCQLVSSWIEPAIKYLKENSECAVVCGRRRERYPEASVYNALCDMEWNTQCGDAKACGGDFIIRSSALQTVNGFRDDFIAGEEPEMCFRLRAQGFKIYRIDADMTLHDAQILRFSQWWRRTQRCGYAYALGAFTHGNSPERYKVKEVIRPLFWALGIPVIAVVLGAFLGFWTILFLASLYVLYLVKMIVKGKTAEVSKVAQAWYSLIGKFAETLGVLQFVRDRLILRKYKIIEYK